MDTKLIDLLTITHSTDMEYYLEQDIHVLTRIEEILIYLFQNNEMPKKGQKFKCDNTNIYPWLKKISTSQEPLYIIFNNYIYQPKINRKPRGEEIWNFKYQEFYDYISDTKHIPKAYEKTFFDGSDMYKWYCTQNYRTTKPNELKCRFYTEEQQTKMQELFNLVQEISLTNSEKIKELYLKIIETEKLPLEPQHTFSNNSPIHTFYNNIITHYISLNDQEQRLFNQVQKLLIRMKKDGLKGSAKYNQIPNQKYTITRSPQIKNSHFNQKPEFSHKTLIFNPISLKTCLAYYKKVNHLTSQELANIIGLIHSNYNKLENGNRPLTPYRIMQFIILVENSPYQDKFLAHILTILKHHLNFNSDLQYQLFKLCTLLAFNDDQKRPFITKFYQNYRRPSYYTNDIKDQPKLLNDLIELENSENLLPDETTLVTNIKNILTPNILNDNEPTLIRKK